MEWAFVDGGDRGGGPERDLRTGLAGGGQEALELLGVSDLLAPRCGSAGEGEATFIAKRRVERGLDVRQALVVVGGEAVEARLKLTEERRRVAGVGVDAAR